MSILQKRRQQLCGSGTKFVLPTFTGSHAIFGDESKGYIELYSSGTLTLSNATYDVFLCGSGYPGTAGGGNSSTKSRGGRGGYTYNVMGTTLSGDLTATIGYDTNLGTLKSSSGTYVAAPASDNIAGQDGKYPFNSAAFKNYKYGASGGCGQSTLPGMNQYAPGYAGGTSGGGLGGALYYTYPPSTITGYAGGSGTANSGGGGGGGGGIQNADSNGAGGAGGSGIIIVRWGY